VINSARGKTGKKVMGQFIAIVPTQCADIFLKDLPFSVDGKIGR